MPERIAILCSDLHLSHTPPVARSGEPDWYESMARPLRELCDLAEGLPVLCGGDVFDRWNSPPKLITFAMQMLPRDFHSVMGQHDLPYHSWEQRMSSAFWTLVQAGTVELCSGWAGGEAAAWRGFQWDEEIEPASFPSRNQLAVCVAHRYVWSTCIQNPAIDRDSNHLRSVLGKLRGYRAVLLGDNHRGFLWTDKLGGQTVFNAGTFMRRRTDEQDYAPMIGFLLEDGSIEMHRLDTSQDKMDGGETVRRAEQMLELDTFVEELRKLGESGLDFRRAVEEAMVREQVSKEVRWIILEAMEKGDCR